MERSYEMREFTAATRRLVLLHQKLADVSNRWEILSYWGLAGTCYSRGHAGSSRHKVANARRSTAKCESAVAHTW